MGVPALILGTFINVLHAVSAATLVMTSIPETLSEFSLSVNVVFANSVGDSVCIHGAQKVVVILKLEQLGYLTAAPHPCQWKCGVSLVEWQSLS